MGGGGGSKWTINDERRFLKGLGSWAPGSHTSRQNLLKIYISTFHKRDPQPVWGNEALFYAKRLYGKEFCPGGELSEKVVKEWQREEAKKCR